jgi:hypothetical protein
MRMFRRRRREVFREQLRDLLILGGLEAALVVGVVVLHGIGALFCAWALGALTAFAFLGWYIGGDVFSLPWMWGSLGEQATGEELEKLGSVWFVAHDIENSHGNWDHVVVGPGGVFLVDTKNLQRATVTAAGDGLSSGRTRLAGGSFRGGAVGLGEAIAAQTGSRPWVQAVVAVWGKFPQKHHEHDKVVYLAGDQLAAWLQQQPRRLTEQQQSNLAEAVRQIADASTASASI